MYNISLSETLVLLVSLIPNNNIRYAMLGLGASITVLYGVNLQRPSVRLAHLEHNVGHTVEMIQEAKSLCPRDRYNIMEEEGCLLKVLRAMCILRSTLLVMPAVAWIPDELNNYRRLRRDIYQCEQEVKRIQIAVQLIVEAERQRKYTEDICEIQAIITATQDSLSQLVMYNQSGSAV
ncbi:hypothetical protein C8R44DRAFT_861663 [Mycena epipterygia]|nr:hypothetical protein C8R44DRAFT_861663 [Mycena epipterygia]